jgi:hypothetical protein
MMIPMGFSWGSTLYFLDVRINTEELSRLISILISHKCYYHFNGWSRRLEDVAIRGFIDRAHCHGLSFRPIRVILMREQFLWSLIYAKVLVCLALPLSPVSLVPFWAHFECELFDLESYQCLALYVP